MKILKSIIGDSVELPYQKPTLAACMDRVFAVWAWIRKRYCHFQVNRMTLAIHKRRESCVDSSYSRLQPQDLTNHGSHMVDPYC